MKSSSLNLSTILLCLTWSMMSCTHQLESPTSIPYGCDDIGIQESWRKERCKNDVFMQFPEYYEGVGLTGFEGNLFFKDRKDNKVKFSYSYCMPLYCDDFGNILSDLETKSLEYFDGNTKLNLTLRQEFCVNGERKGILFYNADTTSTAVYFMKTIEGFQEAMTVRFDSKELPEVLQIISTITPLNCLDLIACTEVFVSISVSVVDNNGKAYTPAKSIVTTDGGEVLVNYATNSNYIILADDSHKNRVHKDGTVVTYMGYDDKNQLIANEKYKIGHDCCHVLKLEGKDTIIVK